LNQSRFDLVVFDPKGKKEYVATLSVQYASDYDTAEKELKLNELAEEIFATFELKD
jgi:hypothetical protein